MRLLRATWQAFNDDKAQRLAAAIAYSTIFSLAPLLIVLIAIVGGILEVSGSGGHASAENALLAQIQNEAGAAAAQTIRQLIDASFHKPRQNLIAQTVGWAVFVFGAAGLFGALQDALNVVWGADDSKASWKQIVRNRIVSAAMLIPVGLLLVLTFVANAAIAFASAHLLGRFHVAVNPFWISALDQLVTLAVVTVVFGVMYKVLPDARVAWRDVWIGAAVTALLFDAGEALISLYIAYGVSSAYGAAGSLLVALVWIYYSALILLLGAEFTKVYALDAARRPPGGVRH